MQTYSDTKTGTVVTNGIVEFDMTNLTAAEFQVTTVGTAVGGSYKIQKSNNGVGWIDISSATGSFTTATTLMTTITAVVASRVRLIWAITSGTVTYTVVIRGKEHV